MKAAEIGRRYVDFFAARGHTIVPSASLLYNDPTLLFVNAGMVPFKAYFIGAEPSPYKRAVSLQKCVRTLDIEDVGKTTRHGTFFQMLGNFSFGDYFKREAIEWAWELVTGSVEDGCFGFEPDKIWVTVLGAGLHPEYPEGDIEAKNYWKAVGVPDERIQSRGLKDNYWNMGIPGPGGPCSEIYIDRGPEFGPEGGPNADEDRYLEIWNLVFQQEDLSVVRAKDDFDIAGPLPGKNIDTGAGLERIALLMQGVDNMYETDEVFPVIARASELSGKKYGTDHVNDVRLRVIGDHVRSSLMLMTDGVAPGNEARGYVLRRLMRRSIRSMRLLGYAAPSVVDLLDVSRNVMHTSYPDIDDQWERIREIASAEEESFGHTLNSGTALFDLAAQQVRSSGGQVLAGDKAFQLHDTYGFPIDLTLEMAAEQGLSVDQDAFRTLMNEQRQRAKADARAKKGSAVQTEAYQVLRAEGETPFLGYTDLSVDTKVRGLIADGESVTSVPAGSIVEVVLRETPFYAESGGQDSDRGILRTPAGDLKVLDVQRPVPGLIVHKVEVPNELAIGDAVTALVDGFNRRGACQAHSATHVLHAALRELIGSGATQAGSFNKPGYLRFDYSSTKGLSPELRAEIEERCNVAIRDDLEVTATQMKLEDAKALGAMAMFGEKYPPIVRMVEMGGPWSRELCGGTHVQHSSQIGLLSLLGEQSVGSGARRVEALVSTDAFAHMAAERALVNELSNTLRVQPDQLGDRVQAMVAELKSAQKTISELRMTQLQAQVAGIVAKAADIEGVLFAAQVVDGADAGDLRSLACQVRDQFGARAAVVVLIGSGSKPSIVVAVNGQGRDLGIKAGEIVRHAAVELGGKGGGKDDIAQGGGSQPDAAPQAIEAARHQVEAVLGR
ncbi:alanine--tRNA ligase [Brooklawnia sp.]|uniref:alanine--tRNA ligase n=1 Tax=Brooklawnia sp. TaxID=2699740 RepID=UPI00311F7DE1